MRYLINKLDSIGKKCLLASCEIPDLHGRERREMRENYKHYIIQWLEILAYIELNYTVYRLTDIRRIKLSFKNVMLSQRQLELYGELF